MEGCGRVNEFIYENLKMFGKKKKINNLYPKAKEYADIKIAEAEERARQMARRSMVVPEEPDDQGPRFSMEPPGKDDKDAFDGNVRYSVRRSVFDDLFLSDEIIGAISDKINAAAKSTFIDCLLLYIDANHLKDSAVYKAAGIDRRLYSKMVSDRNYKPSKDTCIALCFALKLHEFDFKTLLAKAGYTFSDSIKRVLVIEYFLKNRIYDVACINGVLEKMGYKPLN